MRILKYVCSTIIVCLGLLLTASGQGLNTDSLENLLRQDRHDTLQYQTSIMLAKVNLTTDIEKALMFGKQALEIAERLDDKRRIGNAYNFIALGYDFKCDYGAMSKYALKGLKVGEEINDPVVLGQALNNLGNLYIYQGQYDKSLEYFLRFYDLSVKTNNRKTLSSVANNIGVVYEKKGNYKEAFRYYNEALKIREELDIKQGIAESLNNLGNILYAEKDYAKCSEYYQKAQAMSMEIGDQHNVAGLYINLARVCRDQGDLKCSLKNLEEGKKIASEIDAQDLLADIYSDLGETHAQLNNYKDAYSSVRQYATLKDTLFNEQSTQQIAEMQTKFETEKKEKEIELQKAQIASKESELSKQTTQKYALAGGLAVAVLLAGLIFMALRSKHKANKIISLQKNEVELQKAIVEEKNRDILDSIHYAKRIQNALLKEEAHVSMHLPEHFILFKPKDIVSGDFYWSLEKQSYWYVAVADCTGHGVPGAFLTMLGTAFLNEINATERILSPSEILDQLRVKFTTALTSSKKPEEILDQVKDGMDISLLRIDLQTNEIEWSGANNPLWIIKKDSVELIEFTPDKQPIGFHYDSKNFTNHKVKIEKGDSIYIFSDGFADQFGGPKGKKFMYKPFKKELKEINASSMNGQKDRLTKVFENWKGHLEQVDDVTVVGFRV